MKYKKQEKSKKITQENTRIKKKKKKSKNKKKSKKKTIKHVYIIWFCKQYIV